MYGCQQVLLNNRGELKAILEFLCSQANKLTNCGFYYARQIYFKTKRIIGKYDLEKEYKNHLHFKALYSQAAQQILRSVSESMQSFKALNKKYFKGELTEKPKLPNYRKRGLALVSYPKQALKLVNNEIRIPLGKQVKAWFGLSEFYIPMPSNLDFKQIKELRILPRNRCFYAEFVYKQEVVKAELNQEKVLGIDHGLDNWLTCVSNIDTSFIVDGKKLKSINQWYNKQIATIKENKAQGFWSNKLAHLTEKRNRQMRDAVNKADAGTLRRTAALSPHQAAAKIVINHCLENQIGTIVFGWNIQQKQEINLGAKNNQKFVQIPTAKLKERIAQLAEQYGIKFVETEESYTSKASFLDADELPKYGEKPKDWKASGRRIARGLYKTALNWLVNADCNGAANILKKVQATLGLDLKGVNRGSLTMPLRVQLWAA